MHKRQARGLQSLRAVQAFLDEYGERLGATLKTSKRKQLDDAVADLAAFHADQAGSANNARSFTERQRELRRVLVKGHMTPISRIARADLPDVPDLLPLRMPRGRVSTEKLAGLAKGMGQTASRFTDTFVAAGLAADFVVRLNGAADAMTRSIDERARHRSSRTGATKALKAKLARARRIVGVLDAFVQNAAAGDAFLLGKWDSIKRVQLIGSSSAPATEGAVSPAVEQAAGPATTL